MKKSWLNFLLAACAICVVPAMAYAITDALKAYTDCYDGKVPVPVGAGVSFNCKTAGESNIANCQSCVSEACRIKYPKDTKEDLENRGKCIKNALILCTFGDGCDLKPSEVEKEPVEMPLPE